MNWFAKLSLIIWLLIFLAFAIMFDLFGSRELASSFLESSQVAVEKLEETGDHMQDAIDVVSETTEPARDEIKEQIKE